MYVPPKYCATDRSGLIYISKRVADVIRYGFHLQEDSPPGLYLVVEEGGGSHVVVKDDSDARTGDEDSESVTTVETSSVVSTVSELLLKNCTQIGSLCGNSGHHRRSRLSH